MKAAYSANELGQIIGRTERAIRKRAAVESWAYREEPNTKGGGHVRLYLTDSLPEAIRSAVASAWRREHLAERPIEELEAHLRSRRIQIDPSRLADPAVRAKIECSRTVETAAWGERGAILAVLAARHGKSEVTIRRWVDEVDSWRAGNLQASARSLELEARDGTPGPRIELPPTKKFCRESLAYGIAVYAKHIRNGMRAAYDRMAAEAAARSWTIGDYSNFTRALKKIPAPVWDRIQKGSIGFEKDAIPKVLRAWLQLPVYSVLCGDQHIFDYQVVDLATGATLTPECYVWMDCTSRAWTGVWPELGHYNSFTVGMSLREACRLGIPDEVYTDWGMPEAKSKYMTGVIAGLSGFATVRDMIAYHGRYAPFDGDPDEPVPGQSNNFPGPEHRKARPGTPWPKPIENQFNVLERNLAARYVEGYRKRDTDAWVAKERNLELKKARDRGTLLSTEEFLEVFRDVIAAHNSTAMRAKECPGTPIVPAEVLMRGLVENPRTSFDSRTLDYLFLPRFPRRPRQALVEVTVRQGDRRSYYSPLLSGRRDPVQVSVDPYDPQAPAILSEPDGSFIDLAEPWGLQNPRDREGLQQKLIAQARLRKWWREQMRTLGVWVGAGVRAGSRRRRSRRGRDDPHRHGGTNGKEGGQGGRSAGRTQARRRPCRKEARSHVRPADQRRLKNSQP